VAEKHDFRGIQQKIQQVSYFAKKRDSNPPFHGDTAADIAKMFANKFSGKSDFGSKTQFLLKSDREIANFPNTQLQKSGVCGL
jgi:hypothetical protein